MSLKKETRIGLLILAGTLGIFAVVLAFTIWENTPFFDMRLVTIEVALLLSIAALFATALMAPPD